MKLFLKSVLFGAVALVAAQVQATTFTDVDVIHQQLIANGPLNGYFGNFNILDHGFVPGQDTISSAQITFSLADNFGNPVTQGFSINVDGTLSSSQYTSFLVLGTTQVTIDLLTSLNADGILNYNVKATSGDFWLESASLSADASLSQATNPVPDNGSTLIFAVLALAGLVVAQRHTAASRC